MAFSNCVLRQTEGVFRRFVAIEGWCRNKHYRKWETTDCGLEILFYLCNVKRKETE